MTQVHLLLHTIIADHPAFHHVNEYFPVSNEYLFVSLYPESKTLDPS